MKTVGRGGQIHERVFVNRLADKYQMNLGHLKKGLYLVNLQREGKKIKKNRMTKCLIVR